MKALPVPSKGVIPLSILSSIGCARGAPRAEVHVYFSKGSPAEYEYELAEGDPSKPLPEGAVYLGEVDCGGNGPIHVIALGGAIGFMDSAIEPTWPYADNQAPDDNADNQAPNDNQPPDDNQANANQAPNQSPPANRKKKKTKKQ